MQNTEKGTEKMKRTADSRKTAFLLKNLEENEEMIIEFKKEPKEDISEVDSKDLHFALSTLKLGEQLLVRFSESHE